MRVQIVAGSLVAGLLSTLVPIAAGEEKLPVQSAQRTSSLPSQSKEIPNPQIDPKEFLTAAAKAMEKRASRRLSEEEFIRRSREKGVVVLDARSKNRYDQIHIKGAISLPFTDFTFDTLRERLPDKSVMILIYCNNNFRGNVPEFLSKAPSTALNLSTFSSLYSYGYHNVYELGPELDLDQCKLELEGTNLGSYRRR